MAFPVTAWEIEAQHMSSNILMQSRAVSPARKRVQLAAPGSDRATQYILKLPTGDYSQLSNIPTFQRYTSLTVGICCQYLLL
jgi:hypothetical protein